MTKATADEGNFLGEKTSFVYAKCRFYLVPPHHLNTLYSVHEVINSVS